MHASPSSFESPELVVDLFAGGGGMSAAIEQALGQSVDVAVNDDRDAIALHEANHTGSHHYLQDVWEVDPREATGGRAVGLLHASPDCRDHSQARGGQPRSRQIRSLSWVVTRWAGTVRPRVITLENVKQIQQWGPLVAKRDAKTGRVVRLDGTVAAPGERVPLSEQYLVPDKKRLGATWRTFVHQLQAMGYEVRWFTLRACDYGAPTSRERLFLVARCDGQPIIKPTPTHAQVPDARHKAWRTAADCIDWDLPCPSIFERAKPLAEATLTRIAKGIKRYVLEAGQPFIVPITHHGSDRFHDTEEPLRTITTAHRGEFALVSAYAMQANGGFNVTPGHDLRRPMSTITNTGSQQQLVTAHLAHLRGHCDARDCMEPLRTISAGGEHHAVISAFLSRQFGASIGHAADAPLGTITAGGGGKCALAICTLSPDDETRALRVAAFLMRYYGEGGQWGDLRDPMATITTKDRLALVTVSIQGIPYVIVDIGLRMLTPRELFRAQGFPDDYIIDRDAAGRTLSKSTQVRLVGNSVSPPPGEALIRANYTPRCGTRANAA